MTTETNTLSTTHDLRKPRFQVNDFVITTKGHMFKLVGRTEDGEHWLDVLTGITWEPVEKGRYTLEQAWEQFGDSLPSIDQYKEAFDHGLFDVLTDGRLYHDKWFSTRTRSQTDDRGYAYCLAGVEHLPRLFEKGSYKVAYVRLIKT